MDTYRSTVAKAKRAAILRAARAQFLRNGFTHTGMTDIACDADVSTATLYKHFRSKDILFAEIVEETSNMFRFEFTQPTGDGGSLVDSFCAAAKSGIQSYLASDMQSLMRIVIAEVPFAPELARTTYARMTQHWYNETIRTIDDLIAQGLLKPHNTQMSARFLIGMIKETFLWEGLFRADHVAPDDEDGRRIRTIVELFLNRHSVTAPELTNVVWLRN
ncbi:MAG: TetR/AcrR family transcriptional regulator [Parvibaculum sp.]|nr:TetR/AcrR family transcriptional regulator [Parvibaculum sp.]